MGESETRAKPARGTGTQKYTKKEIESLVVIILMCTLGGSEGSEEKGQE